MQYQTYNRQEISIMRVLSENVPVTKDEIIEKTKISETAFDVTISRMISSGDVTLNDSKYSYTNKLDGNIIVLDGNLLLPVITVTKNDKLYVTRGTWYEFPIDFDVRRIIWNDVLNINLNGDNASLVDLLVNQSIKEKKIFTQQLPEYEYLKNKIIPYSDKIGLHIMKVGEETTEIRILFKTVLTDGSMTSEHKGFGVKSVISTIEMLEELEKDTSERNYENIKLNRIVEIRDIMYVKNEIPLYFDNKNKSVLVYAKLNTVKSGFSYEIRRRDMIGNNVKIDNYYYESVSEGIESLWDEAKDFVNKLFKDSDFNIDLDSET